MNQENINTLIDRLESLRDDQYNQSLLMHHGYGINEAGTAGCIVAHAYCCAHNIPIGGDMCCHLDIGTDTHWAGPPEHAVGTILDTARDWLEITESKLRELADACPYFVRYEPQAKIADAIRTMERLRDTGKVDWKRPR